MSSPQRVERRKLQGIAKSVLAEIVSDILPDSTEHSICAQACELLLARGIRETWYYKCSALVLLGRRSCLSVSGRDYAPDDEPVGLTNLITIDLSPLHNAVWADCARSIFVECGIAREVPMGVEFGEGYRLMTRLHQELIQVATPVMSFGELHTLVNARIQAAGFENLDFLGNVGHSVESRLDDREFIEAGNARQLGEVECFTFEPHLRRVNGQWGFKHENIYEFNSDGVLEEL